MSIVVKLEEPQSPCSSCALQGLELTEEPLQFCSTKLIDVTVSKLYGLPTIAVKWSLDTTCYPIIGCNAHRFRIELFDAMRIRVGVWYADANLRDYYIAVDPGQTVTSQWSAKLTVEERVLVWFDCDTQSGPVKILQQGEDPGEPQKGEPGFEKWIPYVVVGTLGIAGVVGLGYLIRSFR